MGDWVLVLAPICVLLGVVWLLSFAGCGLYHATRPAASPPPMPPRPPRTVILVAFLPPLDALSLRTRVIRLSFGSASLRRNRVTGLSLAWEITPGPWVRLPSPADSGRVILRPDGAHEGLMSPLPGNVRIAVDVVAEPQYYELRIERPLTGQWLIDCEAGIESDDAPLFPYNADLPGNLRFPVSPLDAAGEEVFNLRLVPDPASPDRLILQI
jgi:hypothetical protein